MEVELFHLIVRISNIVVWDFANPFPIYSAICKSFNISPYKWNNSKSEIIDSCYLKQIKISFWNSFNQFRIHSICFGIGISKLSSIKSPLMTKTSYFSCCLAIHQIYLLLSVGRNENYYSKQNQGVQKM